VIFIKHFSSLGKLNDQLAKGIRKCHSGLLARRPFGGAGSLGRLAEERIFLCIPYSSIIQKDSRSSAQGGSDGGMTA